MNVDIYSRKAVEELLKKGFPEKTAVISFYDPPNIRTGAVTKPVDYQGYLYPDKKTKCRE